MWNFCSYCGTARVLLTSVIWPRLHWDGDSICPRMGHNCPYWRRSILKDVHGSLRILLVERIPLLSLQKLPYTSLVHLYSDCQEIIFYMIIFYGDVRTWIWDLLNCKSAGLLVWLKIWKKSHKFVCMVLETLHFHVWRKCARSKARRYWCLP